MKASPKVLTAADKLNGFEWRGNIYFRFEAERISRSQEWRDALAHGGLFNVDVAKKQGQGWDASLSDGFGTWLNFARKGETVPYQKAKCENASNYQVVPNKSLDASPD